jgi:hypothetical protein
VAELLRAEADAAPVNGMSWQLIVALVMVASIGFVVNMLGLMMIVKVNEALPERERISCWDWRRDVTKQYRRIYPRSKLPLIARIFEIALAGSS